MLLSLNVILSLLTLIIAVLAIGGETFDPDSGRLNRRGWLSVCFLLVAFSIGVGKEFITERLGPEPYRVVLVNSENDFCLQNQTRNNEMDALAIEKRHEYQQKKVHDEDDIASIIFDHNRIDYNFCSIHENLEELPAEEIFLAVFQFPVDPYDVKGEYNCERIFKDGFTHLDRPDEFQECKINTLRRDYDCGYELYTLDEDIECMWFSDDYHEGDRRTDEYSITVPMRPNPRLPHFGYYPNQYTHILYFFATKSTTMAVNGSRIRVVRPVYAVNENRAGPSIDIALSVITSRDRFSTTLHHGRKEL